FAAALRAPAAVQADGGTATLSASSAASARGGPSRWQHAGMAWSVAGVLGLAVIVLAAMLVTGSRQTAGTGRVAHLAAPLVRDARFTTVAQAVELSRDGSLLAAAFEKDGTPFVA